MVFNKNLKKQTKSKQIKELVDIISSILVMPNYSLDSIKNIDNIKELDIDECPICNENHVIKYGIRNDRQRYKCKTCGKVFDERTASPISYTKISLDKWFKYIDLLINKVSIRKCAKALDISIKTSFFMRHKILNCLSKITEHESVAEHINIEKVYFKRSHKGIRKKSDVATTHVKEKDSKSGDLLDNLIEQEDVCIEISSDINGDIISAKLVDIKENFTKEIKVKYNIYKKQIRYTQNMKKYSDRLKIWIKDFRGVSTKYLSNYLNLFFWSEKTS